MSYLRDETFKDIPLPHHNEGVIKRIRANSSPPPPILEEFHLFLLLYMRVPIDLANSKNTELQSSTL